MNEEKEREQKVQELIKVMEDSISPKTLEIINDYNNSNSNENIKECLVYNSVGTAYAKL